MAHGAVGEGDPDLPGEAPAIAVHETRESLISKIYRDIALAAIASELQMPASALEPELGDAVKRGVRYIEFLLKSRAGGPRTTA